MERTEVAASFRADPSGPWPVEAVAAELITPVDDGSLAGPEPAVKTEGRVAFP